MATSIPRVSVIATEMSGFIVACSKCSMRSAQPSRYQADALAVEHQGQCKGGASC